LRFAQTNGVLVTRFRVAFSMSGPVVFQHDPFAADVLIHSNNGLARDYVATPISSVRFVEQDLNVTLRHGRLQVLDWNLNLIGLTGS
jgi:hypothetical protein